MTDWLSTTGWQGILIGIGLFLGLIVAPYLLAMWLYYGGAKKVWSFFANEG